MSVNSDGMKIFKSSSEDGWPIVCRLLNVPHKKMFLVGTYMGPGKLQSCDKYLNEFVDECNDLIREGITIGGKKYSFRIYFGVFDAPAKSFQRM